ncbi:hypothetical protein WOC76_04280 [Methylocystis sp. IM3]|uniref:hypothetical protein n=1 Tax=unclassified Methylocystis TaxID=2625913 RepID=UPI0030F5F1BB
MDWKTAATLLAVAPFLALAIAFLAVETAAIFEALTAGPRAAACGQAERGEPAPPAA